MFCNRCGAQLQPNFSVCPKCGAPVGSATPIAPRGRLERHLEVFTHAFMPPVLFSLGSVFLLVAAGGILVGWGLMRHERWARTTAIVLAILALFHPPFFTALGIYTLWVLLPANSAAEYDRFSKA